MKKIFLLLVVPTLFACKKEVVQGPQGPKGDPAAPVASGTIIGKVAQVNEDGIKYTAGLNTTTVSLEGKSLSTTTDAGGNYTLTGVAPGVYTAVFDKPGTGKYKAEQISHPGNGNLVINATLGDKPAWQVTSLTVKDTVVSFTHYLKVVVGQPQVQNQIAANVYFSRNPDIDPEDPSTYDHFVGYYLAGNSTSTALPLLSYTELVAAGYTSGTVFYARAFPINTKSAYYHYLTQNYVYPAHGAGPEATALIMP